MTCRRILAALLGLALVVAPAPALAVGEQSFTKYYEVQAAFEGRAETLYDISTRLLGDTSRYTEILHLNTGRKQPGGGVLTDPAKLSDGWLLVLPWDAYGDGVEYGLLPEAAPEPQDPPSASPKPPASPAANPQGSPQNPQGNAQSPQGSPPANRPVSPPAKPTDGGIPTVPSSGLRPSPGGCTVAAASAKPDWAALRIAANKAWPRSRGEGQTVAVVDSGVDGLHPQLSSRVRAGINVTDPKSPADVDCLGTGTSIAAIVAARATGDGDLTGVAPDAMVLPVRILTTTPTTTPYIQTTGITKAVAAGATVLALGTAVDPTQKDVAEAIRRAVQAGAVVVVSAPSGGAPAPDATDGVIRVAGVGAAGQSVADYRKGAVDVSAPGVNVRSAGISGGAGSGGHYAVAYVAGVAALVRAAYPDLSAEQVRQRILATADGMSDVRRPDPLYGWGMVDPGAAVSRELPAEANGASPDPLTVDPPPGQEQPDGAEPGGQRRNPVGLILVTLLALGLAVFLGLRFRRIWRGDAEDSGHVPRGLQVPKLFRRPPRADRDPGEDRTLVRVSRPLAPVEAHGHDNWGEFDDVPAEYAETTANEVREQ
ncbi:hypothetical protein J2S43_001950 [Catenuloplanes nepalensis]|uniref:Peptidase S8/S53 domain-containing protein n=1 Tax=Catenuloplanes nepalensis TaxID=587533 RepID=A0ABT9MPW3_9ACTN|nr:S8 family serine peptidase [Catenuloplanes nepalensis]MDP9793438.1 hypothetical protein [Catenuloplanes nepalensis]